MQDHEVNRTADELPDPQLCRVRQSFLDGYFECAGKLQNACPYCMSFGELSFCQHVAAPLIHRLSN